MPTMTDATPKALKPYLAHGVHLEWGDGEQAAGDCPWCDKEGKFSVHKESGKWKCWVCGEGTEKGGGNIQTFLRLLFEHGGEDGIEDLANDRTCSPDAIRAWGIKRSPITGDWLLPGWTAEGKLSQAYRWVSSATGKRLLLPTPGLKAGLFGVRAFDPKKPLVYVGEAWTALALFDALRRTKAGVGGTFSATSSLGMSLAATANVLGVPGCGSIGEPFVGWLPLFRGKRVVLAFDSDHPPACAGLGASKRAAALLQRSEGQPEWVGWIKWGPDGYDPKRKTGWDVRDMIKEDRIKGLAAALAKVEPVPDDWLKGRSSSAKPGVPAPEPARCEDWGTLVAAWRKAMVFTEGLDRGLSVCLAAVISTKIIGDQLWVKLMGPASCGKSTICEALAVSKRHVHALSTLTGFHSGFKEDATGDKDFGLIPKIKGKTLVVKDGDTLMASMNKDKILSEARDLYDCVARSHYGHGVARNYEGVRMTLILCGTASLRAIDQSELGERFLDCVILDGIPEELEDDVCRRVVYRTLRGMGKEADGTPESQNDEAISLAMRMTGGYVDYLRDNAPELLGAVEAGEDAIGELQALGKFVAIMRARPSVKQDESAEREFSARLVSQLARLSVCIAAVLGRKTLDAEVMRRVRRTAVDTARGRTMEIARVLFKNQAEGMTSGNLAAQTGHSQESEQKLLRFLRRIGGTELFKVKLPGHASEQQRWRLTPKMLALFEIATKDQK